MSESVAVEMRGISKSFGPIRVLENIDFSVHQGEIHALAGGNGAGKSTLMKILEGVYTPDTGELRIADAPVQLHSSQEARTHGIAMVFQEFSLIPTLTIAQNVFLTREPRTRCGFVDDHACVQLTRDLFTQMGVEIDPRASLVGLSPVYWQLTEIAKALSQNAQVLILDEPTASLATREVDVLFALLRRLKACGVSIIYISHRMDELFAIADRITVLRDGRRILTGNTPDLSLPVVIDHMIGRSVTLQWEPRQVERTGTPLLSVQNLHAGNRVRGVTFDLYAGEILGLAGLLGSGLAELARTLYGIDRMHEGQISIKGHAVRIRTPRDALAGGIALVPEDRRIQGLVLAHAVRENLLLPLLGQLNNSGFINEAKGDKRSTALVARLDIRLHSTTDPVQQLSGGNQQKVVLAKWLGIEPQILLMDEPTVGVDIGTKAEIVRRTRELANEGKGILFISSELSELLAVSDRILIFKDGCIAREMNRLDLVTEEALHLAVQGA